MHVSISFSCEEEYNDLSRSLAKFSSELILHLHGSGDGGGGVYAEVGGGGGGSARPGVVSACFLYYQLINLGK